MPKSNALKSIAVAPVAPVASSEFFNISAETKAYDALQSAKTQLKSAEIVLAKCESNRNKHSQRRYYLTNEVSNAQNSIAKALKRSENASVDDYRSHVLQFSRELETVQPLFDQAVVESETAKVALEVAKVTVTDAVRAYDAALDETINRARVLLAHDTSSFDAERAEIVARFDKASRVLEEQIEAASSLELTRSLLLATRESALLARRQQYSDIESEALASPEENDHMASLRAAKIEVDNAQAAVGVASKSLDNVREVIRSARYDLQATQASAKDAIAQHKDPGVDSHVRICEALLAKAKAKAKAVN